MLDSFVGQGLALADLVRAEEQGLDLNRLLFIRYLVLTGKLTDELAEEPEFALAQVGASISMPASTVISLEELSGPDGR